MADCLTLQSFIQILFMNFETGAGVKKGNCTLPKNKTIRTMIGQRPGIGCDKASQTGREPLDTTIVKNIIALKNQGRHGTYLTGEQTNIQEKLPPLKLKT